MPTLRSANIKAFLVLVAVLIVVGTLVWIQLVDPLRSGRLTIGERIGFAVVQMPFHHPVRLATQLALLDNLSKGRIVYRGR